MGQPGVLGGKSMNSASNKRSGRPRKQLGRFSDENSRPLQSRGQGLSHDTIRQENTRGLCASKTIGGLCVAVLLIAPLQAQQLSLQALVTPSTTISKDGHPVTFAASRLHRIQNPGRIIPLHRFPGPALENPGRCRAPAPGPRTAAPRNREPRRLHDRRAPA